MSSKRLKVVIAAGGSGGHLFPAQQLSQALISDCEVLFAGHGLQTSSFFAAEEKAFVEIAAAPFKRGFVRAAGKGFWQSVRLLFSFRPDLVVGFGSYHTFPLLLAAALLGKKIILFEANAALGKVNRFFYPWACKMAFQFPFSQKKGVLVPLLPWGRAQGETISPQEARRSFGLDAEKRTFLIFGGSQGASFLNEALPLAMEKIPGDFQILHLIGKGGKRSSYARASCIKEFEPNMPLAYAAADYVICRSGAGTIAELIRYQKPALLIPFPSASEDHQRKNGEFFVSEAGGGRLLIQAQADLSRLVFEIEALVRGADQYLAALQSYELKLGKRVSLAEVVRRAGGEK